MGKDCLPLEHGPHVVVRDGRDIEQAEWTADEGGRPSGGGTGTGTGGHILRRDEGHEEGGERSSQKTQGASIALPYWIKGSRPSCRIVCFCPSDACRRGREILIQRRDPKAHTEGVRFDRPIVRGSREQSQDVQAAAGGRMRGQVGSDVKSLRTVQIFLYQGNARTIALITRASRVSPSDAHVR